MDKTVSLTEAKSQFSALVEDAIRGDEITITKHGKPVAKIIKYQKPQLVFGALVGKVPKEWLEIDFDDTSHMAEAWDQWRRNLNEIEL
jgi:prevent-host-death family protein